MFTRKYNIVVFRHTVTVILLISCVESQRRWAGTYPTEPPQPPLSPVEIKPEQSEQFDYNKPDYEETSHLKPETPYYPVSGGDNRKDDANVGRHDQIQPGIIDARRQNERRNPFLGIDDDRRDGERDPTVIITEVAPKARINSQRSDGRDPNLRKDQFPNPNSGGRNVNPSGNRRVVVISHAVPQGNAPKRGYEDDSRKDSLPDLESKRGDEPVPNIGRSLVGVEGTKRPPVTGNNGRTFTDSRKNHFPNTESDRRDERVFTMARNSSRESIHENDRKDFSAPSNGRNDRVPVRKIDDEKKDDRTVYSISNGENYRPNRGSNADTRPRVETRPKLEPSTTARTYYETRHTPVESRKRDEGRRFGTPADSGSSADSSFEHERRPEISRTTKDHPPSRNPSRVYPVEDTRIHLARPLQRDTPGGTKIGNGDGTSREEQVGFHPDISYDAILFPKDDEDGRYREDESSNRRTTTFGNRQRYRTRTKREVDLHEDVEILPGFSHIAAQKEVLRMHEDETKEEEVDIFSPVEIKISKSN